MAHTELDVLPDRVRFVLVELVHQASLAVLGDRPVDSGHEHVLVVKAPLAPVKRPRARSSHGRQAGATGVKGTSRSSPGCTTRAVPVGTSRHTPGRSPSGSDTITRDSSEKIENRASSG